MQQRSNPLDWIEIEDGEVDLQVDQFPDGSFRFEVDTSQLDAELPVQVRLKSTLPEAIVAIHQVVEALQKSFRDTLKIELIIQTAPDQRADRVETFGQSVPARVSARLLGALDVTEIYLYDVHSDVFVSELRDAFNGRVTHVNAADCFEYAMWENDLEKSRVDYVVAVDKGARKRAEEAARDWNATVIYADKKRVDGEVVGHMLDGTLDYPMYADQNIWVVDDLCDGGATFISVAKLLRSQYTFAQLNLYVTHGLFSKGKEELSKYYDNIIARFDYT
jgi:ribose-phosphate pyrophosphokinase